jgi:hypothetical protein
VTAGPRSSFLNASTSRAQLKDRLSVVPEKLKAGPMKGVLLIDTNDPEFRRLTIPITATVEDGW